METTEADGELQIVTECWVEPQHGLSINNTPERTKFNGLTYEQISRTVSTFLISHIMLFWNAQRPW